MLTVSLDKIPEHPRLRFDYTAESNVRAALLRLPVPPSSINFPAPPDDLPGYVWTIRVRNHKHAREDGTDFMWIATGGTVGSILTAFDDVCEEVIESGLPRKLLDDSPDHRLDGSFDLWVQATLEAQRASH